MKDNRVLKQGGGNREGGRQSHSVSVVEGDPIGVKCDGVDEQKERKHFSQVLRCEA